MSKLSPAGREWPSWPGSRATCAEPTVGAVVHRSRGSLMEPPG